MDLKKRCMAACFGDMPGELNYDWVMFKHGTYFAFPREPPTVDIKQKAMRLIRKNGSVEIGKKYSNTTNGHE